MSLVELSVVVTITGILATLATYSVRERTSEAHSVEAIAMLGNIRSGLLVKSDDLSGNSADSLQIGGRVGGFGGPLGLPGVLGKNDKSNGNGSNKGGGIDGDGNNGHGNNPDGCDPDNPGNGGKKCGGDTDSSSGDSSSGNSGSSSGSSSSGSGSSGSSSGSSGSSSSGSSSGSGSSSSGDSTGSSGSSGSTSGSSGSSTSTPSVDSDNALCTSAAPVPASLASVKGGLYQSRPSEWAGTRSGGWRCLSVSMSGAQRFQYGYDVGSTAVPMSAAPAGADATFAAWARGDLDGDGRNSWFVLSGASIDGRVTMAPAVTMIDKGE